MKNSTAITFACVISLFAFGNAQAAPATPTQVVNSFYSSVVASEGQTPAEVHPDFTKLSKSLAKQIQTVASYPQGYNLDADPWGGAQVGIDRFAVTGGSTKDDRSKITVNVHRVGCDTVPVSVFLIKEDGAWKIDNVVLVKSNIDLRVVLKSLQKDYNTFYKAK